MGRGVGRWADGIGQAKGLLIVGRQKSVQLEVAMHQRHKSFGALWFASEEITKMRLKLYKFDKVGHCGWWYLSYKCMLWWSRKLWGWWHSSHKCMLSSSNSTIFHNGSIHLLMRNFLSKSIDFLWWTSDSRNSHSNEHRTKFNSGFLMFPLKSCLFSSFILFF